jgi:4-amino-4-deoxy-L-arabinose transferase-like glycosyltransferase
MSQARRSDHARAFLWALASALLLGALVVITRSAQANRFVSWDEPAWVYRSVLFLQALRHGDWAATRLTGHPGVITMWCGAAGLWWHSVISHQVLPEQLAAIAAYPELAVHDLGLLRRLSALLPAAKSPLPWVHGALIVAIYAAGSRAVGRRYALPAALLLALDPYLIGLSRLLHIDALVSELMVLSLALVATAFRDHRRWLVVLSGVTAGVAVLTKTYGVLVAPVALAALAWPAWHRSDGYISDAPRQRWRRALVGYASDAIAWGAGAVAALLLLWPAMWVEPLQTLGSMLGLSLEYATAPGDATALFFAGQVTRQLGPGFYGAVLAFRSSPLAWLGLAAGVIGAAAAWRRRQRMERPLRAFLVLLLFFTIVYVFLLTMSQKKFDRYMLPALLAWDVLAGLTLSALGQRLAARWSRTRIRAGRWGAAAAVAAIVLQGLVLATMLDPGYPLAYYNPLLGGPGRAVEVLPVGWGEGIEQAAGYLDALPDAAGLIVASWAVAGLAPHFRGDVVTLTAANLPQANYVVLYLGDIQSQSALVERFYGVRAPTFVTRINGIEYAWVYRNGLNDEVQEILARHPMQHGTALVTNEPTTLARPGALPWASLVVDGADDETVAGQLGHGLSADTENLLLVDYTTETPHDAALRRLVAQNGLLLWQEAFSSGTVAQYRLVPGAVWQAVPPDRPGGWAFGDMLELTAYGWAQERVQYRQELGLALAWQAVGAVDGDYHLFLHLVDQHEQQWGQRDVPLRDGLGQATSAWQPGDTTILRKSVPLQAGLPPGQYWLEVGLYDLDTLTRLPVSRAGSPAGSSVRLGPITVVPAQYPATVDELGIANRLAGAACGDIALVGFDRANEQVDTGGVLMVKLFWHAAQCPTQDVDVLLELVGAVGQSVALWQVSPVDGYPTGLWPCGESVVGLHQLTIPDSVDSGPYHLVLSCVPGPEAAQAPSWPLAEVEVQQVERQYTVPAMQHVQTASFGDVAQLLGYDLDLLAVAPDGTVRLILYWQVGADSDTDYTVFVHLLDGFGQVRGQHDGQPAAGRRPTTGWLLGEIVTDQHELLVDARTPPGACSIEVGLYDGATGERLIVTLADNSRPAERRVLLQQTVAVE